MKARVYVRWGTQEISSASGHVRESLEFALKSTLKQLDTGLLQRLVEAAEKNGHPNFAYSQSITIQVDLEK